jgi:hypothetical protein
MSLLEFLSSDKKTILLDGAMGTQLAEAGVEMGGQSSITRPDVVLAIHQQYVECGVDLLITNTLTMNRVWRELRLVNDFTILIPDRHLARCIAVDYFKTPISIYINQFNVPDVAVWEVCNIAWNMAEPGRPVDREDHAPTDAHRHAPSDLFLHWIRK